MASQSEIGHAKNVANFEDLISFCVGYGVTYNPVLNAIKVANMNTLKTNATSSLTSAVNAYTAFKNASNNREIVFEPVKKLTTKIMAALKACGATEQSVKDATTINFKIQGKRAKPIKDERRTTKTNRRYRHKILRLKFLKSQNTSAYLNKVMTASLSILKSS